MEISRSTAVAFAAGVALGAGVLALARERDRQRMGQLMATTSDVRPAATASRYNQVLAGRVAVVTGSGIGIGRAVAERFAQEGAAVVVGDFNDELGQETVARIEAAGGKAVFQHVDCTQEAEIEALMARAVTEYGRLDHLVNNAVRFVFGHLRGAGNGSGTGSDRDITDEDWDMLFKTNVPASAS